MCARPATRPPAVSVVMPVYNGAGTLREAVDSVLMQTMDDLELVVCNDASTDDTRSILEGLSDRRVVVIHNETNLGEGRARDRAIGQAKGVWLAVIDADDTWDAERLASLLRCADPAENAMVFDDIMECHDTARGMVAWRPLRGEAAFGGNGRDPVSVPVARFVASKRLLIKPLIPSGYFRAQHISHSARPFGADTEFFLALMATGMGLRYVPKPLYNYRITPGSASGNIRRSAMMREVLETAMVRFNDTPEVRNALEAKIAMVARDQRYFPFMVSLKERRFAAALRLGFRSPWLVAELIRRSRESIAYNMHRIWCGGRARGVR
jgi:succinoglycan biosynthesis protein ExoO